MISSSPAKLITFELQMIEVYQQQKIINDFSEKIDIKSD